MVLLLILDGWGIGKNKSVSAIEKAKTPFIDSLYLNYPHSTLEASGLSVGLPDGQMGNSEVGHLSIGSGRIVYQMLVRINKSIEEKTLEKNITLNKGLDYAIQANKNVHLIGLVSDGGVHSHINHLKAMIDICQAKNIPNTFIHAFTDGRDTDTKSGIKFISDIQNYISPKKAKIGSLIGRYYAMDRDRRWERTSIAYQALVRGKGIKTRDILSSLRQSYYEGITDEFVKPIIQVDHNDMPIGNIEEQDVVICFNFRTDRCRQITEVLTQEDHPKNNMKKKKLHYITMTEYDKKFKDTYPIFINKDIPLTLGEVLSLNNKKQLRVAESEKYPHVTFFFSGGRETIFNGEQRILCPSPKVASYDMKPEMSAYEITDKALKAITTMTLDFICINIANPDMVGHTGVFKAAVKACETVDICTQKIIEIALASNYTTLLISDHGNIEVMYNSENMPHTSHTTNLVPCILIEPEKTIKTIKSGILADVAPTILKLMKLNKPLEMTGKSLL